MTATFDDGDVIRARYVVGADGIHSIVREQAGIGFQGSAYDESFVLADVRLDRRRAPRRGDPVLGDGGPDRGGAASGRRLPHRRAGRRRPRGTHLQTSSSRFSTPAWAADRMTVTDVIWGSRFRVHHRVADTYRAGRLLLAGDAAHVHSPAGGQGMNLGIQDAVALGDALAAVLGGGAGVVCWTTTAPFAARSPKML